MGDKIDLQQALGRLRRFVNEHKRPPSFDEIRAVFGYRSKNAAFWLVEKLLKQGLIAKDTKGKLMIEPAPLMRFLGSVQAGFPAYTEAQPPETLDLNRHLVQDPENSFLLKVTGDSMVDAGIYEGDLAVVEKDRRPRPRDIVVARIDGDWTLKYYDKKAGKPLLLAANKRYPSITPKEELVIAGVVVAVIRRYP